jgi:hypothetical protein
MREAQLDYATGGPALPSTSSSPVSVAISAIIADVLRKIAEGVIRLDPASGLPGKARFKKRLVRVVSRYSAAPDERDVAVKLIVKYFSPLNMCYELAGVPKDSRHWKNRIEQVVESSRTYVDRLEISGEIPQLSLTLRQRARLYTKIVSAIVARFIDSAEAHASEHYIKQPSIFCRRVRKIVIEGSSGCALTMTIGSRLARGTRDIRA